MLKKIICAALTVTMLVIFSVTNAATPKSTPEETVLAYAELYALGTSNNLQATGLPADISANIEKNVVGNLMTAFMNYPLYKDNFKIVKEKYIAKLHDIIKISARVKKSDAVNPVIEISANTVDQEVADKLKAQDPDFLTMDVMNHISNTQELVGDGEFQKTAVKAITKLIDGLTATEPKTFDVTCKLVTDDSGNSYWMPENAQGLFDFVMINFAIKEVDPYAIDNMINKVFSENADEEKAAAESKGNGTAN